MVVDEKFEEGTIVEVLRAGAYSIIRLADGRDFGYQEESKVVPKPGMTARIYGNGRGLFVDGREVFYHWDIDGQR